MKTHCQFVICWIVMLTAAQVYGQSGTSTATINIQASSPAPASSPKKYFVEICELPNCDATKSKRNAAHAGSGETKISTDDTQCKPKKCQTITLDQIPTQYLPASPLKLNVKVTSDLAPAVAITSSDNNASWNAGDGTIVITGPGEVTVTVNQPGNKEYAPAATVTRKFRVDRKYDTCLPPLLPPATDQKAEPSTPDASTVISLLGNPYPFSFQAAGKDKILIYANTSAPNGPILAKIKKQISDLIKKGVGEAAPTPPKYSVELLIPHAFILGDLASLVNSLNYSDFAAQDVGKDRVHITSSVKLSCEEITAFYSDLRNLIWRPMPESPIQRVFYFNAPDLIGAVGSGASGAPSGGSGGGGSGSPPSGGQPTGSTGPGGSAGGGGGSSQSGTISSSPGSGGATSTAGAGLSSTQATSTSGTTPPPTQAGSAQPSASSSGGNSPGSGGSGGPGNQSGTAASTSAVAIGSDYLVFSESNPGDDIAVAERKRILAALDLPRPEMIINVWSSQKSSKKQEDVELAKSQLQVLVNGFNEGLQTAVNAGWTLLKQRMEEYSFSYFKPGFADYISQRYVADGELKESPDDDHYFNQTNYQEVAEQLIGYKLAATLPDDFRLSNGLCRKGRYCLGYVNLFRPLRPRMTDLLLTALASSDPPTVFEQAINTMEQRDAYDTPSYVGSSGEGFERLNSTSCEFQDQALYHQAITNAIGGGPINLVGRPLYLECFRQTARRILSDGNQPSALGLARAAIADFLFQYKLSQQYPHDFSPYDLQQSAQTLNAALAPFIDAFNRDVRTFQSLMIDEFMIRDGKRDGARWLGSEQSNFGSNAIITVRTISGVETTVNTTTSNFLDATQQPAISDLLKSIEASATGSSPTGSGSGSGGSGNSGGSGAAGGSSGSGGSNSSGGGSTMNTATHMKDLLQNISPIQAQVISGVLSAVQSSKVQIGPSLNIDVTPRSLSGASSAEIVATIKADTASSPTFFGGPQDSKAADISRVAQHDTTTRVRVESIKMFEISTLNAELEKSRSRFPLLPPFVEIPYLGTLLGVPLPVAKEYHTSSAVISAIVIPTAADIVAGLRYRMDRLVTSTKCTDDGQVSGDCKLRPATSLSDFNSTLLRAFHRRMIQCFAEDGWSEYPGLPRGIGWHTGCGDLTFEIVQKAIE